MDIFIEGLEVYGHHGVTDEEKVLGQRLLYDVRLTMETCPAALTDDVADTIDYTEVMDVIVDVVTTRSYSLLERLAQMSAEAIIRKFPVDEVWVQVTSAVITDGPILIGHVGLVEDITKRRMMEQEREAKVRELELLNRVMMGREERVLELKERIKALQAQVAAPGSASQASPMESGSADERPR